MSASPRVSEAELLNHILGACYALAAASFVVWLAVFAVRSHRLRRREMEARAEEEVTGLVLDQLAGYPAGSAPATWRILPPWKREILLRVLQNLIEQTKGRDRAQLVRLLDEAGFRDHALASLSARKPEQRQLACELLGVFDDEQSVDGLRRGLRDRDAAVRVTAARALMQGDRIDSLRELLERLQFSREDPPLLLSEILGRLPQRLEAEATVLLGEDLPAEWLRIFAIALGRRQVFAAFDPIAALRKAASPRVRAAAWVALRELGDPRAGEIVLEGLSDSSPDVRLAAAECAGSLGGPDARPLLESLLKDSNWFVQYQAARALIALGPESRAAVEIASRALAPEEAPWQAWREYANAHGR
jgi:HEAT repeat protein